MQEKTIEQRVEKIENWLTYDGGQWYTDMVYQLVKVSVLLILGYIFLISIMNATAQMMIEKLPEWCTTYGNI